jgi:hypothetical protein
LHICCSEAESQQVEEDHAEIRSSSIIIRTYNNRRATGKTQLYFETSNEPCGGGHGKFLDL